MIFFTACSPLEISRLFGAGTKQFLKKGKINTQEFDLDYFSCYNKSYRALKDLGANIYRGSKNKGYLVAMDFTAEFKQSNQSTEVALFFEEISKNKTRLKVASLNSKLSDFAAKRIFNYLNPPIKE
ncbi:MAG: hypothetical protein PHV68_09475 [Candidatus Gastranaerophilales bacterium]|nr:hypothetical protein [Candidatus Gastranaerophilales bacterium]